MYSSRMGIDRRLTVSWRIQEGVDACLVRGGANALTKLPPLITPLF